MTGSLIPLEAFEGPLGVKEGGSTETWTDRTRDGGLDVLLCDGCGLLLTPERVDTGLCALCKPSCPPGYKLCTKCNKAKPRTDEHYRIYGVVTWPACRACEGTVAGRKRGRPISAENEALRAAGRKRCPKCSEVKDLADFGRGTWCKRCVAAAARARYVPTGRRRGNPAWTRA